MIKIRYKNILCLSIGAVLLSSSLLLTDNYRIFSYPLLAIGLFLLVFRAIIIGQTVKVAKYKSPTVFLFLFAICSAFSGVYNDGDFSTAFLAFSLYVIWLIINKLLVGIDKKKTFKYILNLALLTHIPLFIIGILMNGLRLYAYEGFFYNPNSLGTISSTLFCALISVVFVKIRQKEYKVFHILISYILLLFLFFFVVISSSRTSFITIFLITFLIFIYGLRYDNILKIKSKTFISAFLKSIIFLVVLTFIYINSSLSKLVDDSIIAKFEAKEENITAGRELIWEETINQARLLGYGRDYFGVTFDSSAHNSFISMLGQNGILTVVFYILFWLSIFRGSYLYLRHDFRSSYRYFPIVTVLTFLILSLGESMNGKLSMFLVFVTFSLVNRK